VLFGEVEGSNGGGDFVRWVGSAEDGKSALEVGEEG